MLFGIFNSNCIFQVGNYKLGINVLGLITFCLAFGVIIGRMKEEGAILVKFFCAFNEAVMQIVSLVIWQVFFKII